MSKVASVTSENAKKIGGAAAHAGSVVAEKAQDGSLANQGSAVLGNTLGALSSWGKAGWGLASKVTSDSMNVINQVNNPGFRILVNDILLVTIGFKAVCHFRREKTNTVHFFVDFADIKNSGTLMRT